MILVKYIAASGFLSRRKSEEAIKEGSVRVNDLIVKDPTHIVKEGDIVFAFKTRIVHQNKIYLAFNKPIGYLTSKSDPEDRRTIYSILPKSMHRGLDPVGRLDINTSGLLLLSNDGDFVHMLSHPRFNIAKRYQIRVSRPIPEHLIEALKRGVRLEDGLIKPDAVEWDAKRPDLLTLELHSGKYRVIRRLLGELGVFIDELHRVSFGSISLKGIAPGKYRELTEKEVENLKKFAQENKTTVVKRKR